MWSILLPCLQPLPLSSCVTCPKKTFLVLHLKYLLPPAVITLSNSLFSFAQGWVDNYYFWHPVSLCPFFCSLHLSFLLVDPCPHLSTSRWIDFIPHSCTSPKTGPANWIISFPWPQWLVQKRAYEPELGKHRETFLETTEKEIIFLFHKDSLTVKMTKSGVAWNTNWSFENKLKTIL